MARSIRLIGISKADGSNLLRVEPTWWAIDEIDQVVKFNWIESNDTGSYTDFNADITVDEARTLHEHFKLHATRGMFSGVDTQEFIKPDLDAIEASVGARAVEFSHFRVCIFEWESGM